MGTFIAVMSFPFWFLGAVFVFLGIWGNVTVNGLPYYGEYRGTIKLGATVTGLVFFAIAYAMVSFAMS